MRNALVGTLVLALISCSKETDSSKKDVPPPGGESRVVVLKVDGMQRGEGGKTGMAGPESVKKALEGLKGVTKVEMDLDRDLFRVTLAGKDGATQEQLFEAIRALSYTPSLAGGEGFHASEETTHPMGEMPELVRKAIDRAKAESKRFILVDCMGDNGVACKRMSVKTFADSEVEKILDEHFVFVELNVDHEKEAAGWFAGKGIPDTGILGTDGKMLDRVVGFMEPNEFAARLRKLVGQK